MFKVKSLINLLKSKNKGSLLPSVSVVFIMLTMMLCFFLTKEYSWDRNGENGSVKIIDGDGIGYYMYLPNIFINKTFTNQIPDDRFIINATEKGVNKYPAGTAIAILPFFGVASFVAFIDNDIADGLSTPFQKSVSIAALFYLFAGLWFLKKFLSSFGINDTIISAVILLIVFGTNLLTYTVIEPSMSHIYSFCFVTSFLFCINKLIESGKIKYFFICTVLLGMIILIRPVNGIIVFIVPFLAGSFGNSKRVLKVIAKAKFLIPAILIFLCILSVQFILWYIQTGSFFLWSYQEEGFYFGSPQIFNFLFSFRKGLFIYTPLVFISLLSFYAIYRKSKFEFFSLFLFLLLLVYIFSSWWNWYYGPSFGQRVFVEYYCIIGLLLAILIKTTRNNFAKVAIYFLLFIFVALNLIQNYQYQKGIISSWDMTFNKYSFTFLKTSNEYIDCLGGNDDILPYKTNKKLIFQNIENFDLQSKYCQTTSTFFDSASKSVVSDFTGKEFNIMLNVPLNKNFITKRVLFAEVSLDRLEIVPFSCCSALLVFDISDSTGKNYFYYRFHINDIPFKEVGKWKTFRYNVELPKLKSAKDKMNIFIWNLKKQPFYIDNFVVKIFTIN
jgi:hypothetical protein